MTRIVQRLPIDCDLSAWSVAWAASLLGETPVKLWVTPDDDDLARRVIGDMEIGIDETIPVNSWYLEGATRDMYSAGA